MQDDAVAAVDAYPRVAVRGLYVRKCFQPVADEFSTFFMALIL